MLPETEIGAAGAARLMGRLGLRWPSGPSLTQPRGPSDSATHCKVPSEECGQVKPLGSQESSLTGAHCQPPEAAPCLEFLFHFAIYHMLLCSVLSVQGVDRAIPPLPKQPLGRLASGDNALTQAGAAQLWKIASFLQVSVFPSVKWL